MLYEIVNQSELTTTDLVINLYNPNLIKSLTYYFLKDGVKIDDSENTIMSSGTIDNFTIPNLTPYSEYKIYFKNISPAGYQIASLDITATPGVQNVFTGIYAATIYGYKRDKNNSDPAARITYTNDAVGKIPAAMDFTNKVFNYGSWKNFCDNIAFPVMLKYDGTPAEYLKPSDLTRQTDGTASSVTSAAFEGNAMVMFDTKFKWIKRWEDDQYQYVNIANDQIDEDYHAYAFTNALGKVKDFFALGIYHNRTIANSSKVNVSRSISAAAKPTVNLTIANAVSYAQANGDGWDLMSYQQWSYVRDLIILITKSDNVQTSIGYGWTAYTESGSATHVINGADKLGAFYGTKNAKGYTTSFNLVDLWGNCNTPVTGLAFYNGEYYIKNTPPYNIDASNYERTHITPYPINTTKTNYWASVSQIYKDNWLPTGDANGSGSTYFCDTYQVNHAATLPCVVVTGGYFNESALSGGLFDMKMALAYNGTSGSGTSSRLSYINPT